MDPEKDLLDIPTELEIPIEEEKQEDKKIDETVLSPDAVENVEAVDSLQLEITSDTDSLANEVVSDVVSDVTDVQNNIDENNVTIDQASLDGSSEPESEVSLPNESNILVDQPVIENNINQQDVNDSIPTYNAVMNDNAINTDHVIESQISSVDQTLENSNLTINEETLSDEVKTETSIQSVPIIQPLDSTIPPDELDIKVDDVKKKKKKKKFNFKLVFIILIIVAIIGAGIVVVPKFLNKTNKNKEENSLNIISVSYKDSFEQAYSFTKIQPMEVVKGEVGTYSVENDYLIVNTNDKKNYKVVLQDIFITDVAYFGTVNGMDVLMSSDMFGNTYIYSVYPLTKDIELDFENEILSVPSGVDKDSLEMGVYPDGSGAFFISRINDEVKIIERKDNQYVLSVIPDAMRRGQPISISFAHLSDDLMKKVDLTGVVLEYTGGIYVYKENNGSDIEYPINNVSDAAYNAKELYLVTDNDKNIVDLYIFFEKDGKEFVNVVDLVASDLENGKCKLYNYNSSIKKKEITNNKVYILMDDGSSIEK